MAKHDDESHAIQRGCRWKRWYRRRFCRVYGCRWDVHRRCRAADATPPAHDDAAAAAASAAAAATTTAATTTTTAAATAGPDAAAGGWGCRLGHGRLWHGRLHRPECDFPVPAWRGCQGSFLGWNQGDLEGLYCNPPSGMATESRGRPGGHSNISAATYSLLMTFTSYMGCT